MDISHSNEWWILFDIDSSIAADNEQSTLRPYFKECLTILWNMGIKCTYYTAADETRVCEISRILYRAGVPLDIIDFMEHHSLHRNNCPMNDEIIPKYHKIIPLRYKSIQKAADILRVDVNQICYLIDDCPRQEAMPDHEKRVQCPIFLGDENDDFFKKIVKNLEIVKLFL